MKPSQDQVFASLRYDPLAAAEEITGESYKTSALTENLGFAMHFDHVRAKRALLAAAGDTSFDTKPEWLIARLLKDGFDLHKVYPFTSCSPYNKESYDDRAYLLFCRRRGILVWMETYARGSKRESLSSVKAYWNWRPARGDVHLEGYSGHGVVDPSPLFKPEPDEWNPQGESYATVGDYDGREGLFTRLAYMEENGQFITPWLERPWLWLLTYMDTKDEKGASFPSGVKGYDHNVINAKRLADLPEDVRRAVLA